ncbi:MAG: hypothetical protein AAF399_16595 [Bacteroidota bacterium]
MNAFNQSFHQLLTFAFGIILLVSSSSCYVMYDLVEMGLKGDNESFEIQDQAHFSGEQSVSHYKDVLDAVGQELNFRVTSESPEGFIWIAQKSSQTDRYFLGKHQGTAIAAYIQPAVGEDYQLIPGKKTLHMTLSASGNYHSVSREQLKPLFEEVEQRFLAKL